ncbi:MAG TPA: aminotransferase class I/II-fold pyridoxal phosphate-dependent enzyme, partial [candidate division Zixibacteria bacterium]|nr:aminotransferase class I/II-fold pyridoxal phosphate-dependent enzyme [candidate division Zixibacteria bacterium]
MAVSTAPTASLTRLHAALQMELDALEKDGRRKGAEFVTTKVIRPAGEKGPRYHIRGYGDREFLKMNSNSYLGMSLRQDIIDAEERAALAYGAGPGAVRFISGTFEPHVELEKRLAEFHGREAGMIFSSAYSTVMGVLVPLITKGTAVISDELNHNCIIN